jgi:hypothetical protein
MTKEVSTCLLSIVKGTDTLTGTGAFPVREAGRRAAVDDFFLDSLLSRPECAAELVSERSEPLRRRNFLAFGVLRWR